MEKSIILYLLSSYKQKSSIIEGKAGFYW
jgi:hypothetical protein